MRTCLAREVRQQVKDSMRWEPKLIPARLISMVMKQGALHLTRLGWEVGILQGGRRAWGKGRPPPGRGPWSRKPVPPHCSGTNGHSQLLRLLPAAPTAATTHLLMMKPSPVAFP